MIRCTVAVDLLSRSAALMAKYEAGCAESNCVTTVCQPRSVPNSNLRRLVIVIAKPFHCRINSSSRYRHHSPTATMLRGPSVAMAEQYDRFRKFQARPLSPSSTSAATCGNAEEARCKTQGLLLTFGLGVRRREKYVTCR